MIFLKDKEETKNKYLDNEKRLKNYMFKITHEIKNPIAVCKGYLEMMDTNDIPKTTRYISIINSEIERTLNILKDILEFNKINLEKDIMDITMLLEEIKELFKELLRNKDIKLELNNPYDELLILGDYNRLKQVIINMIKNSMEAKHDNKRLIIKLSLVKDSGNIIISISDNGIGMTKEVIDNIGKEFFTTKQHGTGLGVSISKDIISKHDGVIDYSSKENMGTITSITLPTNY